MASWTHVIAPWDYASITPIVLSAPAGVVLGGSVTYWLAVGADDPTASAWWKESWEGAIDSQGTDAVVTATNLVTQDSDFSAGYPISGWQPSPVVGAPRPAFEIDGFLLSIPRRICPPCGSFRVCDTFTGKCVCNLKLRFCL